MTTNVAGKPNQPQYPGVDLVFTSQVGTPIRQRSYSGWWLIWTPVGTRLTQRVN